jgi:hypothetical protein
MSGVGNLDLRVPIGGLFAVLGVMLAAYGAATNGDAAKYARSGGVNVNLWWGLVLLAVGIVFLLLARRGRGGRAAPGQTAAGREPERREEVLGLEKGAR